MSKVFRDIQIEWNGEKYTFTPSNRLLRKIDAGLSPNTILGVANTMSGQQLPLYDIAYIVSEFIAAGGGDTSEEDVLAELYDDLAQNNGEGIAPLVAAIGQAISPPGGDAGKNQQAPARKTGAKRKK